MDALLKRLLSFTEDGIYRYRLDNGVLLLANRGLSDLLELKESPEELAGRPVQELYFVLEQGPYLGEILRERKSVHNLPIHIRTLRGTDKWVLFDSFVVYDPDLGTDVVEAVVKDITTEKRAEAQLRLDEERLQALLELGRMTDHPLEQITDFALEKAVSLTRSTVGYFAFTNEDESVLTMYSWSREAMEECRMDTKPREFPVNTTGLWGEAIRQRKPVITNDYMAPSPLKKGYPEGHVPISRHMNIPLFDGDHIVVVAGVGNKAEPYEESDVRQLTLLMDGMWKIIKRKRMEEELRNDNAFISGIFASIQDGISVLDTNLRIVRVNPAMEHWYAHAMPLVGKKCHEAYHGRKEVCATCPTLRTLSTGAAACEQVPKTGANGETAGWLELFSFPLLSQSGDTITGVIEYVRDISDQVKAEQEKHAIEAQMQQTQKLESLGVLAGGIAHDFNNLLVGILGNADLALSKLSLVSPARENIENVVKAAQRAADLARQMLAYSGKGRFIVEPLHLSEIVEEMSHILEVSIAKNATLKYHFAQNLPAIQADATQMRQIILNLITNASDAIGENSGVITITTGVTHCDKAFSGAAYAPENLMEGPYVFLEVSDTGCGMDRETQARMFDPFFTTKFTGRGLGLAAVLGIVRGHKGAINVYSESGQGSTFKVLFPADMHTSIETRVTEVAFKEWKGSGAILIADDEAMVREVGQEILETLGFQVYVAEDGVEALRVFQEHRGEIVCILLDLTMPRMNGEETFREIRRVHPYIPIIMSSGYNEQEVTQRFAGKGMAGFIQKPYRMEDLQSILQKTLGK
ncbi:MAG TPA: GAF domain-containing protein [Candidatus Hydrogenedentes bacterium]|nr:GAF domain-containing protein [Candidatus Hydrogenedentota bacterium]